MLVQATSLLLSFLMAVGVFRVVTGTASVGIAGSPWESLGYRVAWRVTGICFLFITIHAIHKRKEIGRFLCLVYIATVVVLFTRQFILHSPTTSSLDAVGGLIVVTPFLYWMYAVGLSPKAKAYFQAPNRN